MSEVSVPLGDWKLEDVEAVIDCMHEAIDSGGITPRRVYLKGLLELSVLLAAKRAETPADNIDNAQSHGSYTSPLQVLREGRAVSVRGD